MNDLELSIDELEEIIDEDEPIDPLAATKNFVDIVNAEMMRVVAARNGDQLKCTLMEAGGYVVSKASSYRTAQMLGGETFTLTSAYVSKVGDVILRFRPLEASNFNSMELPIEKLMSHMAGLYLFYQTSIEPYYSNLKWEKDKLKRQESVHKIASNEKYQKLGYGTW